MLQRDLSPQDDPKSTEACGNESSRGAELMKKRVTALLGGTVTACWSWTSIYLLMAAFHSWIGAHVRKRKGKYPETKYKYKGLTGLSSTIHPAGERRQPATGEVQPGLV